MQSLQLPAEKNRIVNSLDPRHKRYRAADRSLQQARNSLLGANLALKGLPHSRHSALSSALKAVNDALQSIDQAAALLDDARMEQSADAD